VIVDLHGKTLSEAMMLVEKALKNSINEIGIITGKGLHSADRQPVLKPNIEAYLNRNGYWWHHPAKEKKLELYPSKTLRNTGMYIVSDLTQ